MWFTCPTGTGTFTFLPLPERNALTDRDHQSSIASDLWSFVPMRLDVCDDDPCNLFSFKTSRYLSLAAGLAGSVLSIVHHFPHLGLTIS